MWSVDRAFLEGVRTGREDCVIPVHISQDKPYFDIEVIADVRLDLPADRLLAEDAELECGRAREQFIDRLKRLRRSFGEEAPHLLISCGDLGREHPPGNCSPALHSPELLRSLYENVWTPVFNQVMNGIAGTFMSIPGNHDLLHRPCVGSTGSFPGPEQSSDIYYQTFLPQFLQGDSAPSRDLPVALVYRIHSDDPDSALAYVVVVGFDSNDVAHRYTTLRDYGQIHESQVAASEQLVQTLLETQAASTPVYVIMASTRACSRSRIGRSWCRWTPGSRPCKILGDRLNARITIAPILRASPISVPSMRSRRAISITPWRTRPVTCGTAWMSGRRWPCTPICMDARL